MAIDPGFTSITQAFSEAPQNQEFLRCWRPSERVLGEPMTFGALRQKASGLAWQLESHGLRPGDRVILILERPAHQIVSFLAALWMGAVPTILATPHFKVNPEKYRSGLEGLASRIAARLVLTDDKLPGAIRSCLKEVSGLELVAFPKSFSGGPSSPPCQPHARDIAFLQHSAGTTGLQKGVALSHQAVLNQVRNLGHALELSSSDKIVSWLPFYHDMGLIACLVLPLVRHLPLAVQSPTEWVLDPLSFLEMVTQQRATLAWFPNFAFQFTARHAQRGLPDGLDLSSLRGLINCSETIRYESVKPLLATLRSVGLTQRSLMSSYALAENTFSVTHSNPSVGLVTLRVDPEQLAKGNLQPAENSQPGKVLVSSGTALLGNAFRIVTNEKGLAELGRVGEIQIKGDSLFSGYDSRPDLQDLVFSDGWYRTGDLGAQVGEELYVLGRADDLIVSAGRNLYPEDIEELVGEHPGIHTGRVAAFGVFDSGRGTEDVIVVAEVDRPELLEKASEIVVQLKGQLVQRLEIWTQNVHLVAPGWLIKSTAGKIARKENRSKFLRERHSQSHGAPGKDGSSDGS